MIKPMTKEDTQRALERAKANRFDEYSNYGENNGPLPDSKESPVMEENKYGDKYWRLNNKLHREDGPAIEYSSGSKSWYLNNKLHREDGPAIEYYEGTKYWYLNGKEVTEEEVMGSGKDYLTFVESMILTHGRDRLAENTLGLVGEAGEVAEKIKKFFRDNTLDEEAIQKELGDVIFYWYALHSALGLDPQETIDKNVEKLSARKERGTIRGSGDER